MKELSNYLGKFKRLKPPKRTVQNAFIEAVKEECGISLKQHEIGVHGTSIFLTTNPVIKNEVILKKASLLRKLSEKTLGTKITEIR